MSPHAMEEMRVRIESERTKLMANANMAEGEKEKAQRELEKREQDLQRAQLIFILYLCVLILTAVDKSNLSYRKGYKIWSQK